MLEQLLSPVKRDGMEARSKSQHFENESIHGAGGRKIDLHNQDHHAADLNSRQYLYPKNDSVCKQQRQ